MSDTPAKLTVKHVRVFSYTLLMALSLKAWTLHEKHEYEGCIMGGPVLDEIPSREFGNY